MYSFITHDAYVTVKIKCMALVGGKKNRLCNLYIIDAMASIDLMF